MKILSMVISTHKRYENGLLPTENSEKGSCLALDTFDETFLHKTYLQHPNSTNSEDLILLIDFGSIVLVSQVGMGGGLILTN